MSATRKDEPAPLIWQQPPPPPRRRALDRETIVAAAIEIADRGGLSALTMNAVARHLGPYTAMALYRYVHSKDGLVDLMLDTATAEIPIPAAPSDDWRADLHRLAMDTWAMVRRHGWYAQLVHTRPPLGPHMMRRTEFALSVLAGQDVPIPEAMSYASLIDRHIFGNGLQAAEEDRMRERYGLTTPGDFLDAIHSVRDRAGDHPHLTAWLSDPTGPAIDYEVELGLTCLLDGIATRLPPTG